MNDYLIKAKEILGDKYNSYSETKIIEAMEYLSYKTAVTELPKTTDTEYPILYVFRHGQTEDNEIMIFSGWRDSPLTQKGKDQALSLAPKLANKKIQLLVSSPQIRAIETMKIAISHNEKAKDLTIQTDPRIMERNYGEYQGKSKLEIQLEDPEKLMLVRRSFSVPPEGGESIETVCKRVTDFCEEIVPLMKRDNISVAVSCHGNSIRGFRRYFEKLTDEETAQIETPLGQNYAAYSVI